MLKGCEGVTQIKDDILVHGTKYTHEVKLRKVLHKLQEAGFTLRWAKCELGMTEVEWFGHWFSGDGMRVALDKADIIRQWPRPVTVREIKSFLATLQFNTVYLAAEKGEETYTQLVEPFREAARRKKKFIWTQEMDKNFVELKKRLSSNRVMVPYEVGRPTRLDCDSSPVGTQATVSQQYSHPEMGNTWRPVNHTARAWNKTERLQPDRERE